MLERIYKKKLVDMFGPDILGILFLAQIWILLKSQVRANVSAF